MFAEIPLFPEQASTSAERVDALFFFLLVVCGFFTLLIAGLVIYFSVKYRRRAPTDRPPRITGSIKLELFWSVVPLVLSMVFFFWGASATSMYPSREASKCIRRCEVLASTPSW